MGMAFEGMVVAEKLEGTRELVVGAHRDLHFDPVVMVGEGGVGVETMPDNALIIAPFEAGELRRAIEGLRIAPLLKGVRGSKALAVDAVIEAAFSLGRSMTGDPSINLGEINPLIVAHSGAAAVDALVVRMDGEG